MKDNAKESLDPKKAMGEKKPQLQLIPAPPMNAIARVLELGAAKYGAFNWRERNGVEAMTYVGAIRRHLNQWVEGEDLDEESGQSHIAHINANCYILEDARMKDKLTDNRPNSEDRDMANEGPANAELVCEMLEAAHRALTEEAITAPEA